MIFAQTHLAGAYIIDLEPRNDERGFFARSWCANEFSAHGLKPTLAQCNIAFNKHKGTLRGMHYQTPPYQEDKLIRCTMGEIYDVIIDLRQESPTFKQWLAVELTAGNRRALYVPKGFAHGYQTLTDDTEITYQVTEFYHPEVERGVRWDDPAFVIDWPAPVMLISEKDRNHPLWSPQ
jgi:dTDP-4-dehydrorhamnose 3,5-epimerase